MNKRQMAKDNLLYYFKLALKDHINWDSDNGGEISDIVDLIIDAAIDEVKEEYKKGQFPNKYTK